MTNDDIKEAAKRYANYECKCQVVNSDMVEGIFKDAAEWARDELSPEWIKITETSPLPTDGEYYVCSKKRREVSKTSLSNFSNHHTALVWRKRFSHYARMRYPQPPKI